MVETRVVGRRTHDESTIAEHVADDVGVMRLRDVVHHDVLHAGLRGSAGDNLSGTLCVAIHRAVADDESWLRLVAAHAVVHAHHLVDVLMPNGTVGRADVVELHAGQLLQGILHRSAIFTHDVRVVANHLQPVVVAVDLLVDDAAVQCAEAAEGVHGEKKPHPLPLSKREGSRYSRSCGAECHHRLWPVDHRSQHEVQDVVAQFERVAVLHLDGVGCQGGGTTLPTTSIRTQAVEATHHAESLLVADDLHVGVVFLDERQRSTVVRFHVVHHEIVDGTVADHLLDILQEWDEEVYFHRVDEADLVGNDEVRVVAYAIGQGPQALEERLVAVVHAHVIDFVGNFCHIFQLMIKVLFLKEIRIIVIILFRYCHKNLF